MVRFASQHLPEVAMAAFIAIFGVFLLLKPVGGSLFLAIDDLGGVIAPLIAGAIALRAASVSSERGRIGWALIGTGCIIWGLGEAIWTWYEVVKGTESPFPSWADAAYLGAVPFLFGGILVLTAPTSNSARLRVGLDALAVAAAAGAISWHFVVGPIFDSSDATVTEKVLSSAYPLSDLTLLFALAVSVPRWHSDEQGYILGTFGAGLALFLASDTSFAYLETTGAYASGSIVDFGWVTATTLFGMAALLQYRWRASYANDGTQTLAAVSWFQILPICLLPFIVGWAMLQQAELLFEGEIKAPTLLFIYAFTVFVVLRQAAALVDSTLLNRQLAFHNATLEVRTDALSERLIEEHAAANLDQLTEVLSRRAITSELNRLTSRLGASKPLALGIIDVDGLKAVNDLEGHAAGDRLLRLVASALSMNGAMVGRLGGDEFMVLLPEGSDTEVLAYLSLVDWRMGNLAANDGGAVPSFSSGFATFPRQAETPSELMAIADQRMYEVKWDKKRRDTGDLSRIA